MNNVYFACRTCRILTDAGYRWAYWQLEHPGVVSSDFPVSVQDVLTASEYWEGPEAEESAWLRDEILPTVRKFLETHREHEIIYGDYEDITGNETNSFLYWLRLDHKRHLHLAGSQHGLWGRPSYFHIRANYY